MRRGAKPAKSRVDAKAPVARKPVRKDSRVRDLEKRLAEALDQQTASAEILRIISSSPTDVQPVLDEVLEKAVRVCQADLGLLFRYENDAYRLAAFQGARPEFVAFFSRGPITPSPDTGLGRIITTRRAVQIDDVTAEDLYRRGDPLRHATADLEGIRTWLGVPMIKDGDLIGAIVIYRREVRRFADSQVRTLQTFADQAVIAIENVRLFTELQEKNRALTESLEQQTATADILQVISRSPTEVEPVFEAVVTSAARLCEAHDVAMLLVDGDDLRLVAGVGPLYMSIPPDFRIRLTRGSAATRAVVDRATVHIHDFAAESEEEYPVGRELARRFGHRSMLAVPLLREGVPIGVVCAFRLEVRPFPDQQIALLRTFADQAVIAIENVRLFKELEEKNRALTEALEQQTATAEILRVISSSPTDEHPVFDAIAQSSVRLCDAGFGVVAIFDGELLRLVAHVHVASEGLRALAAAYPMGLNRGHLAGRAILDRRAVHVADVTLDPDYVGAPGIGNRATLSVPMLRKGAPIGTITIGRLEPVPFTDQQIALLQTFADQAVIAVENVRLFKELEEKNRALTEALEQQTATAEILRVISSSPVNLQPVFDTIVRNAVHLCRAKFGGLHRLDGNRMTLEAQYGVPEEDVAILHREVFPLPLSRQSAMGRAILDRAITHIRDIREDSEFHVPRLTSMQDYRTILAVPLIREGTPIGALALWRSEVRPFTAAEIGLVETFADQAVIAVQNVRLFNELQARTAALTHSVEQLTALGEVGRAVSSTLDLETVLTTIVSRAVQLSGVDGGVVFEYDEAAEEFVHRAATESGGGLAEARRATRIRKGEGVVGRTAVTLEPAQVPDITVPGAYESRLRQNLIASGIRAVLAVPMVRDNRLIGCLVVSRNAPGDFRAETIELLRTFATQSALAIQNARLFQEIEDKSRQLEAASRHKSEFLANMSHELRTPLNAIIGFSEVLTERMFGEVNEKQDEYLKDIHASGQHLLSLINDILDLSKIEAGRMELEVKDFDLPQAIGNAVTLVRERAGRRDIALHQVVDERLGQIRGDERKVKQVLLNLLSNALKFTPEGGRVEVRASVADGMAEVAVTDTGIGIAPEHQEAVFEEFRQVGMADKKVEGTGLGLALSRKFIELHGGRIRVESQLGHGSTFTFTLPLPGDD